MKISFYFLIKGYWLIILYFHWYFCLIVLVFSPSDDLCIVLLIFKKIGFLEVLVFLDYWLLFFEPAHFVLFLLDFNQDLIKFNLVYLSMIDCSSYFEGHSNIDFMQTNFLSILSFDLFYLINRTPDSVIVDI